MKNNLAFPVNCQPAWHPAVEAMPADAVLKNWLLDTGSLTERLQAQCRHFDVQVIGQQQIDISAFEATTLGYSAQSAVVREVILVGDGHPWVYARTLLPINLYNDIQQPFKGLGSQPLGKILFNDARFQRQPFEIGKIDAPSTLHTHFVADKPFPLWGRRSTFKFEHHKLSVAEIFLPSAPAYGQCYSGGCHDQI